MASKQGESLIRFTAKIRTSQADIASISLCGLWTTLLKAAFREAALELHIV